MGANINANHQHLSKNYTHNGHWIPANHSTLFGLDDNTKNELMIATNSRREKK